jgi:hypothetical protein
MGACAERATEREVLQALMRRYPTVFHYPALLVAAHAVRPAF